MTRLTGNDFKTPMGQSLATALSLTIDWPEIERYKDTDAFARLKAHSQKVLTRTPDLQNDRRLFAAFKTATLNNGDTIDKDQGLKFMRSYAAWQILQALHALETRFLAGTDSVSLTRDLKNTPFDTLTGSMDYSSALRLYPYFATGLYLQCRFLPYMRNDYVARKIQRHAENVNIAAGLEMGAQLPPLTPARAVTFVKDVLIKQGDYVESIYIPELIGLKSLVPAGGRPH